MSTDPQVFETAKELMARLPPGMALAAIGILAPGYQEHIVAAVEAEKAAVRQCFVGRHPPLIPTTFATSEGQPPQVTRCACRKVEWTPC